MRFLNDANLNLNQILNHTVEKVNTLPETKTAGRIVYLIPDKKYYGGDGTDWINLSSVSSVNNSMSDFLDIEYYYGRNYKLISNFSSTDFSTNWLNSGGTLSVDTNNFIIDDKSIRLTENDNIAGYNTLYTTITINLSTFNDGSPSTTSDYIKGVFYIPDVTKIDLPSGGISIRFETVDINNSFKYWIQSGLVNGWNVVYIKKSDFTVVGNANWSTIIKIVIAYYTKANVLNSYVSFQHLGLYRKDPLLDMPNLLQRYADNIWKRDFAVSPDVDWYIGYEGGSAPSRGSDLVCKAIIIKSTSSEHLISNNTVGDFHCSIIYNQITASLQSDIENISLGWKIDANNYLYARLGPGPDTKLNLTIVTNGILTTFSSSHIGSLLIHQNDEIRIALDKKGVDISAYVYKNGFLCDIVKSELSYDSSAVGNITVGCKLNDITTLKELSITPTEYAYRAVVADTVNSKWRRWFPMFVWGTATPTGNVKQITKYCIIGSTVFFNIYFYADNGAGATSLQIPALPDSPRANLGFIPVYGQQRVYNTWTNLMGYIDDDSEGIQFRNFATCTSSRVVEINICGFYEI